MKGLFPSVLSELCSTLTNLALTLLNVDSRNIRYKVALADIEGFDFIRELTDDLMNSKAS